MGKNKLESTLALQRIAALVYNPHFKKEVEDIRQRHRIPHEFRQSIYNFRDHSLKGSESEVAFSSVAYIQLPKGYMTTRGTHSGGNKTLFEIFIATPEGLISVTFPKKRTLGKGKSKTTNSEASLYGDILDLLSRFYLPSKMFDVVVLYLFTRNKSYFDTFFPWMPTVSHQTGGSIKEPTLTVTVDLIRFTTKKEWGEIWDNDIREKMTELFAKHGEPSKKRVNIESLREQMKRWSEWYQLSETEGLGPVKALQKWEKDYTDKAGEYDQSTITHAIAEFKNIIAPRK